MVEEMTMKEIATRLDIPYSIVYDAAWKLRNGKRQHGHNITYKVNDLVPFMLKIVERKIDSAEEKLENLNAIKRNIELAFVQAPEQNRRMYHGKTDFV